MDVSFLLKEIGEELKELYNIPGTVVYSSFQTIKRGNFYSAGLNPGGEATGTKTIAETLSELPGRTENAYLHEKWRGNNLSPYQSRYISLMNELFGEKFADSVFGTNLIFSRSTNQYGIDYSHLKPCLEVHRAFVNFIDPPVIIAIGNSKGLSAYEKFKQEIGLLKIERTQPCNSYHKYSLYAATLSIDGKDKLLIGIPHLSRYGPHENDVNWIKQMMSQSLS